MCHKRYLTCVGVGRYDCLTCFAGNILVGSECLANFEGNFSDYLYL